MHRSCRYQWVSARLAALPGCWQEGGVPVGSPKLALALPSQPWCHCNVAAGIAQPAAVLQWQHGWRLQRCLHWQLNACSACGAGLAEQPLGQAESPRTACTHLLPLVMAGGYASAWLAPGNHLLHPLTLRAGLKHGPRSAGHQRAVAQARHSAYMADLRRQDRLRYYKQAAASNGRQKVIDYEAALKKGRTAAAEEAAAILAAKQGLASCALRPRTAEGFRPVVHVQQPAAQQQQTDSDHQMAGVGAQQQQQQVHEPLGGDNAAAVFQAAGVRPVPKFLQTGKSSRDGKTLAAELCASKWALLPISTREDPEMHQIAAALHDSTVENCLMRELASAGEPVQAMFLAAAQSGVSLTVLHSALKRLHSLRA